MIPGLLPNSVWAHPFPEDESVTNSCLEQKLMTVFTKPTAQSFDGLVVFRGKISTTTQINQAR